MLVAEGWARLSDFTFPLHFHALETEMATHSSVLAWRIPGQGAWWAAVYGVAQSRTQMKRLSSSKLTKWLSISFSNLTVSISNDFKCSHKSLLYKVKPTLQSQVLKFNNLEKESEIMIGRNGWAWLILAIFFHLLLDTLLFLFMTWRWQFPVIYFYNIPVLNLF